MELETRECPCGMKFKCLPSSVQKYHSRNCQVQWEKISFGWTKASREKRKKLEQQDINPPLTTAIISENVRQIRLGPSETENIKNNIREESGPQSPRNIDYTTNDTNLATERNAVNNEEDLDRALPMSNTESSDEFDLENLDSYTPTNSERPTRISTLTTIRQQRSSGRQEISEKEFFHSQSLVDESIGQLQELTKLCVTSLHSQDAKHRDPQMVNSAVNSAKAITDLIRIKLNTAKLLYS